MSNSDSFIDEVTEEVRRDRLFALMRRYGWIAVLAVLILVGGAAWREWSQAQDRAAAQAMGDSILAAMDLPDAGARTTALSAIEAAGGAAALVAMLAAGEAPEDDAEAQAAAIERLRAIAANPDLPAWYTDLAALKLVLIQGPDAAPEARLTDLEPLARPGRPFRTLAVEQMAYAQIDAGNTDAALTHLRALLQDAEASAGLRQRASQLIVALGETPDAG